MLPLLFTAIQLASPRSPRTACRRRARLRRRMPMRPRSCQEYRERDRRGRARGARAM